MTLAATAVQVLWPFPLVCEYIDGINWKLRFEFQFNSPCEDQYPSVTLPPNFITDFASIPKLFWREIHPTHAHIAKMAVVHDAYYRDPTIAVTRAAADTALKQGMDALGAPAWKQQVVYWAVRMGGSRSFKARAV